MAVKPSRRALVLTALDAAVTEAARRMLVTAVALIDSFESRCVKRTGLWFNLEGVSYMLGIK